MKKLLSLLLTLALIFSLAACGGGGDDKTPSSDDKTLSSSQQQEDKTPEADNKAPSNSGQQQEDKTPEAADKGSEESKGDGLIDIEDSAITAFASDLTTPLEGDDAAALIAKIPAEIKKGVGEVDEGLCTISPHHKNSISATEQGVTITIDKYNYEPGEKIYFGWNGVTEDNADGVLWGEIQITELFAEHGDNIDNDYADCESEEINLDSSRYFEAPDNAGIYEVRFYWGANGEPSDFVLRFPFTVGKAYDFSATFLVPKGTAEDNYKVLADYYQTLGGTVISEADSPLEIKFSWGAMYQCETGLYDDEKDAVTVGFTIIE